MGWGWLKKIGQAAPVVTDVAAGLNLPGAGIVDRVVDAARGGNDAPNTATLATLAAEVAVLRARIAEQESWRARQQAQTDEAYRRIAELQLFNARFGK